MVLLTKSQGSYKKFQGRNPYNIFVAILVETMTQKRHFEINWPLSYDKRENDKVCIKMTDRKLSLHVP